jgi:hypothetical protein
VSLFKEGFWAEGLFAESFFEGLEAVADPGTGITNANATADVPTNFEICDRTGFKQYPHHLKRQWDGHYVRSKSIENRHPQEFVKSRGGDKQKGPQSPEGDDSFVAVSIAPEDL